MSDEEIFDFQKLTWSNIQLISMVLVGPNLNKLNKSFLRKDLFVNVSVDTHGPQ